ncbi:IS3 family transposase, partial [Gordonia hongkongensis]
MRAQLRTYARKHPRHGFRRAWAHLRFDDGIEVNKKKVHRLWTEEGLQVRRAPRRKRAGQSSVPIVAADAPKVVWALDFQFDSTVVHGHEKVPTGGQVEVPAGGQIKVPTLCSSCRPGTEGP